MLEALYCIGCTKILTKNLCIFVSCIRIPASEIEILEVFISRVFELTAGKEPFTGWLRDTGRTLCEIINKLKISNGTNPTVR